MPSARHPVRIKLVQWGKPTHPLLASRWTSSWRLELVVGIGSVLQEDKALRVWCGRYGSCEAGVELMVHAQQLQPRSWRACEVGLVGPPYHGDDIITGLSWTAGIDFGER